MQGHTPYGRPLHFQYGIALVDTGLLMVVFLLVMFVFRGPRMAGIFRLWFQICRLLFLFFIKLQLKVHIFATGVLQNNGGVIEDPLLF